MFAVVFKRLHAFHREMKKTFIIEARLGLLSPLSFLTSKYK